MHGALQVFNDGFYAQDDAAFEEDQEGAWDYGAASGSGAKGGKQSVEALAAHLKQQGSEGVRKTAQQYMDEYYAVDYEVRARPPAAAAPPPPPPWRARGHRPPVVAA